MADIFTPAKRSEIMSAIRSKGNRTTELRLIEIFRSAKLIGWRRGAKLAGHPDFVFPRGRLAVFVDGCFWHGCPIHGRLPANNRPYWDKKIQSNQSRDRRVRRELRAKGWKVLRFWEHELRESERVARKCRKSLNL